MAVGHQRPATNDNEEIGCCACRQDGDGTTTAAEASSGDAIARLRDAGVPIIDDTEDGGRGSGLMHHKFLVIDQEIVLTGSANTTSSGIHGDAGALNTGQHQPSAALKKRAAGHTLRDEFHRLWVMDQAASTTVASDKNNLARHSRQVGDAKVEVFSLPTQGNPNHGLNVLAEHLLKAESIDLALFVFPRSNSPMCCGTGGSRGPDRLIADPGFASRPFSEVLDLLGVALPDQNCKLERATALPKPLRGVGTLTSPATAPSQVRRDR